MSEVRQLAEGEATYSKLANADVDCVRKGMNPIRYTVDMSRETTKNLSSSAGSYSRIYDFRRKTSCYSGK